MPKLFVIIVTYDAEQWIKQCIDSVKQSTIETNIIVVDNCSTDQTLALIKELYADIHVITQTKNTGFGQANNVGITYALQNNADYVYLLNQDAWVQSQTFEILIRTHQKHPEFGIISPIQTTATLRKWDSSFVFFCNSKTCEGLIDDLYFNQTKDIYKIGFVPAAHWLVSRECLMAVGGFSPTFFLYGEDNNYVNRAYYHHFKTGICPLTSAVHDREFRKENKRKQIYLAFSMLVYNCSNIYNSNWVEILNSFYFLFKKSFQNNSLSAFSYLCKFLLMLPTTIRNKKISRKRYPNFLFFNNNIYG